MITKEFVNIIEMFEKQIDVLENNIPSSRKS